jgi:predicted phosphoribosyltransferase
MFDDRSQAGRVLGELVARRAYNAPMVVLALPRGGVPVGVEVARQLGSARGPQGENQVEFDVFLVRKLGVPGHEELAFGAIASGGVRVLNQSVIDDIGLSNDEMKRVTLREEAELKRREHAYREGRSLIDLHNRVAILVDDGLATGASMIAAVRAVRLQPVNRVVVAVPVAARQASEDLQEEADEVICAETPEPFFAVGYWYRDFGQTTDHQVRDLLRRFTPAHS